MFRRIVAAATFVFALSLPASLPAQSTNATLTGFVTDQTKAAMVGVTVDVINQDTAIHYSSTTNNEGSYTLPNLPPGNYKIEIEKQGFKSIVKPDVILHVQDTIAINFTMAVGSASESITVEGGAPMIDTQDAAVSTVIDRQFAENLPMNGRSFQTLVELTPGVVVTATNNEDGGQFSVNGQRASGNYWMIDGVSANIGVSSGNVPGNGFAGALGSFSVLGGTNSLVSIDAMQEFRIQTSTYAPEFGRTPGAQISIVTRSGANQFHGTAFDYLRNNIFDANDWFNGYTNNPPLPKAEERQNDFGGTFSGPIIKDHTFFFFSYEGLRLRLPQTTLTTVPDLNARQTAVPEMQPYLNAFPFDPNQPDLGNGIAQFNASYSNPASLDAYSLRIDHKLTSALNLFGRYDYSPSEISQRGAGGASLSSVLSSKITTQTLTLGTTWALSPVTANDLRFNYSRTDSTSFYELDDFGGAVPLASSPFPSPYTTQNASLQLLSFDLEDGSLQEGKNAQQLQQQINIVDNLSMQKGSHSLKFGVDYRRLTPLFGPNLYFQGAYFLDVPSAMSGSLLIGEITAARNGTLLFRNLGLFAQDTWRAGQRLTITYGLRWDVDFAPSSVQGPSLNAVTGFDLNDLSELALAPPGTSPYNTPYKNFAPRLGIAYQLSENQNWQTVLRGGFGVFYDLATQEVGNSINYASYPFGVRNILYGGTFPLDSSMAAPPPIVPPNASNSGILYAFDPHLQLPYTLQWNIALEQALGNQQSLSASYVGAVGRRLIQTAYISSPNPNYSQAQLMANTGDSDYNALQIQFQRRLSHGLQTLASYTWSHSIDDGSAGSVGVGSNAFVPSPVGGSNRGPSDFDIRNAFTAGITYDVPAPKISAFANALLRGWSTENFVLARSAPPVNVYESTFYSGLDGFTDNVRPDVEPGIPLYLYGSNYPGGKAINSTSGAATCSNGSPSVGPFCPPPTDSGGNPVRQGDFGRNALRGFGATQWDFAVHRDFPIRESIKLQFRAEMFNVLNHPNFGPPDGALSNPQFGLSTQMLGNSLGGSSVGGGGLSPLYQIGGPRSIQFALKLQF